MEDRRCKAELDLYKKRKKKKKKKKEKKKERMFKIQSNAMVFRYVFVINLQTM